MRGNHKLVLLLCCASICAAQRGAANFPPASPAQSWPSNADLQQLTVAVHVHTTASTGAYSLSTLLKVARDEGVDAVVLGENLELDFRYAPWPLRYFYELRRTLPSLRQRGTRNFLAELEEVQSEHGRPLLLPGVEVMPHYFWTGSLLGGNKTLHNMQRNLLLVVPQPTAGMKSEDAVNRGQEFLRGIPAIGNPGGERYGFGSVAMLLPGLLLLGYGIKRMRRRQSNLPISWRGAVRALLGGDHPKLPMKEVVFRVLLLGGGMYLVVHNYPYSHPLHSQYQPDAGLIPSQEVIDYARQHGGLAYWSTPEAFDYRDVSVGPVRVRLSTDPHPGVIAETWGHTGFGGVYADNVTLLDAGGAWDASLGSYCRGERATPSWVIGEAAFHYTGQARKRLSDVLTVVWTAEATRAGVFDALARGRSYALRQERPEGLRLQEFTLGVTTDGRFAWPGETLELTGAGTRARDAGDELGFDLVVEMYAERNGPMPVRVEIIRQGEIYQTWRETTPFRRQFRTALMPGEELVYYRVMAHGPAPLQVVTNPIFVRRQ